MYLEEVLLDAFIKAVIYYYKNNSRAILGNEAVVLLASFLNMHEKTSNV